MPDLDPAALAEARRLVDQVRLGITGKVSARKILAFKSLTALAYFDRLSGNPVSVRSPEEDDDLTPEEIAFLFSLAEGS